MNAAVEEPRECVAKGVTVLGMHRSGTSAVAGVFVAAGFYAGNDDELVPPDPGQPAGYNENAKVVALNDDILRSLGHSWFTPAPQTALSSVANAYGERIEQLLEEIGAGARGRPIVLKDPRITAMLPVWEPVIDRELERVVVIRDPAEIALSLQRRNGTPRPVGLASWELHTTAMLSGLRGKSVVVVPYKGLFDGSLPARLVGEIEARLTARLRERVEIDRAGEFIDPGLHRNHSSRSEHRYVLTESQRRLWEFLASLPSGRQILDPPEEFTYSSEIVESVAASEDRREESLREAGKAWQRVHATLDELSEARAGSEAQLAEARALFETQLAETRARHQAELTIERSAFEAELQQAIMAQGVAEAVSHDALAEAAELSQQLDRLVASRSWRLTAPLRALAGWIRR